MPTSDRAVSEVLGFAVVFAVVLAAIGLVAATGYAGLNDAQTAEQLQGAERAFDVLADNVDDVAAGAPARETEVSLGGGRLSIGEPVTVRVHAERASDPDDSVTLERSLRPIVYDAGTETRIAYEAGAVVRADRGGSVMLRRPSVRLSDEAVVLPLPVVRAAGNESVGGTTNALVATRRANATTVRSSAASHHVTIEVVSPRAGAWKRSLDGRDGVDCDPVVDETVSCTLTTDRLTVSVVDIDVALE